MKKRLLSLLLVLVMVLGMSPVSALATGSYGSVHVIVENTKLTEEQGAAWYGTLVDTQIPLASTSTMMSCVVAALETVNAQCIGAESGYIGSINGLGEFAGGNQGAGWMGTLNDWFVDSGFNDVTVAEDELMDGDVIRVMFTLDMGYDLGGGWENQNGYLSTLTVSEGDLTPSFDKETQAYTLTVADSVTKLNVTAKAENKQEKVIVKVGDNEYRRGENINVADEIEISITCGARTYTITVDQATHECSFSEWEETKAPTCSEPGEETRSCDCGETETRTVDALGHDYQNGICSRCKEPDPDYAAPAETVIYTGSDWPYSRYYIASLMLSGPEVDYVDGTHVYLNCKTQQDAAFTLTATAGGSSSGNLGVNWNGDSANTKTYTTSLVNGEATVNIYAYKASGAGVSRSGTKTFYFHVAEPNELPVLAEGQASTKSITKTAGKAYEIDLSKVFYDADDDELTYYVSVDGAAATKTDAAYSYTNSVAGTYILVFTVSDGKGDNNAVFTVTLTLENSNETKLLTVQMPSDLSPKFYVTNGFDKGTDILGAEITGQEDQTADGLTTYTIAYPVNATHISVRTDVWGGMALEAVENTAVVLRQMKAKVVDFTDTETPATVTVTYGSYTAAAGADGWLLETGKEYSVTATPKDTGTYASATVKLTPESGAKPAEVVLKMPYKNPKTITAPAEATVQLFDYNKYYAFTEVPVKAVVENEDGTKTHYFTSTANDLSWRATMDGKITEAGYMPWKGNVTVIFDNGAGSSKANAAVEDNSILVNVNGQNHLKLGVGGSYKLKAFRTWEIIKLSYQNEILTPDMNWKILSGSDVISLTPEKSCSNGGSGEHSDWMTVTALQEGTAVIEVSYDALDVSGDGTWPGLYPAGDPARTGLIVVTVGGEDTSVQFGIDSFASQGSVLYSNSIPKAWDAEFDTLYFTGDSGKLQFAPTAAGTITNVAVSNDKGSSWTTLTGTEGVYTASIVSGNNILRVTTDAGVAYQVVRGDQVTVTFDEQEGDCDGLYEAGETVRVTVTGIHTPIPKMSGNYNPGYKGNTDGQSAVHMTYTVNGESQEGAGAQYDFATAANYIDVIIPAEYAEKTLSLTDGYIGVGIIGLTAFADGGDSHRNIPDTGCTTRGTQTTFHTRSILPEIKIPVGEAVVPVESIALDKTELELVEEETATLTATVLPENATDKTVIWSSSDNSVATVVDGVVTAVKAGAARITATVGEKTATCEVTITAKELPATFDEMYEATAETLLDYEVGAGSIGGEWLMFGLARALDKEPTEQQKQAYLDAVSVYIKNTITNDGKLHSFKSTENARIALALTALGEDPADFAGYDLLKAYTDTTWAKQQGNNGASFALLALNAADYETSNRQALIDSLLGNQNEDGGWAITTGASDMDATSMAIQALAPYYADAEVKVAVDAALTLLASKTNDKGQIDIGSSSIKPSPEVNAQVIVALAELGRDPATDIQFRKNGKTLIDGLTTFFVEEEGFAHVEGGNYNQMATEQAFYAMVACKRVAAGKDSLYDMTVDRTVKYTITIANTENGTITASAEQAVAGMEITLKIEPAIGYELKTLTVKDASNNAVAVTENKFIMPASNVTVTAEFVETENPAQNVIDAVADLTVTKADKAAQQKLEEIQAAYDALSAEDKAKVTNYSDLEAAIAEFNRLLNTAKTEAQKELEAAFDELKEEDYTKENWETVKTLRNKALADVEKAENTDEISAIVKQAKADLEKIATGGEITVTFRLIGDGQHDDGISGHEEYVTWIPTTTYKLKPGATMYDVFMEAIADYGLSQRGASNNYVESIKAPSCLGDYWLGEFDNGPNSGWMYTVNGDHPGTGLKTFNLTDGDRIIWHYVDDYVQEERDATNKYYYRWLEAKDIAPEKYLEEKLGEILTVGEHGKVEPSEIKLSDIGKDITFTFKPDTGYVVKDVIIDGESKGSITTYTYKNLRYDSRIEVKFAKAGELFDDVKTGDWFYDDVMFVVEEGLFNGTGDNKFSPNASMNRAMLVTVLYRLEGEPKVTGSSAFDDVDSGQWYTDAVIWATQNEIVNGYGNGKFGPTDSITREQMATILFRYAQFKKYNTSASNNLTGYSDFSNISVFSLKALKWANAEGLINGRTATTLAPQGTATRAEVAAILHRFVENVVNK